MNKVIENEYLKISISTFGALINSIIDKRNNEELLYQIVDGSWQFQDIVMFPTIGDARYKYNGKDLNIKSRHGFLRNMEFIVFKENKDNITFKVSSNEETLKMYPFSFIFYINYSLNNETLKVETKIESLNNKELYFMYGSHTAIKTKENDILIEFNKDKIINYPLINGLIDFNENITNQNYLELNKNIFKKEDTIILKNNFDYIDVNNGFNHIIRYKFNAPLIALWSNAIKGEFLCLEPWRGTSNYLNEFIELKDAKYINKTIDNITFNYELSFILK